MLGRLVDACHAVEEAAGQALHPLSQDELAVVMRVLARLDGAKARCEVAVVHEADTRGVGRPAGLSTVDWVVSTTRGRVTPARAAQLGQHLKPAQELEKNERAARALYRHDGPAGMTTYRIIMDPEGTAIIDAAVAAWSHPVKDTDGRRDPRPAATRRADALLQVIQRGVARAATPPAGRRPTSSSPSTTPSSRPSSAEPA